MKIAFVSQPFDTVRPPHHNSIGLWIYETARRLSLSHNVTIYTRGRRFQKTADTEADISYRGLATGWDIGLLRLLKSIVWLWPNIRRPQFASWLYYLGYSLQAALDIRREAYEIVHLFNFSQFVPIVRFFNPSVKIVLHMQCEWLSQLDEKLIEQRLQQVDLILGCSEYIASLVRARFPDLKVPVQAIYNGVDVKQFVADPPRKDFNADNNTKRLLFVSRVSPEKGVHTLLTAFKKVVQVMPEARLDIVGSQGQLARSYIVGLSDDPKVKALTRFYQGDDRYAYINHLQSQAQMLQIEDCVSFVGAIAHTEVTAYLQRADVLVNPSLSEAFGISLVEAMACGKPVVATKVGGMTEIVDPAQTGYLVEADDPDSLVEAILMVLCDPLLSSKMGQAGQHRAHTLFSWASIVSRLEATYIDLLETECQPVL
ncbi:MAG: glycosyltransferase family 4 protein [Chloroflexota bacterium]